MPGTPFSRLPLQSRRHEIRIGKTNLLWGEEQLTENQQFMFFRAKAPCKAPCVWLKMCMMQEFSQRLQECCLVHLYKAAGWPGGYGHHLKVRFPFHFCHGDAKGPQTGGCSSLYLSSPHTQHFQALLSVFVVSDGNLLQGLHSAYRTGISVSWFL